MKKSRKRTFAIVVIPVVIILAIVAVGLNQYFNPNVGFTYLEPTYLPPGVSIKEKRIDIYRNHVQAVELNFRTVDWVYSIGEQGPGLESTPSTAQIPYPPLTTAAFLGSAPQNYNASSVKPTCSLLTSSGGQRFRLCHWVDYGRIGVNEVKFVKDGTSLEMRIPSNLQQHITIAEISRFVDSFTPRSTFGIPVLRTNGA